MVLTRFEAGRVHSGWVEVFCPKVKQVRGFRTCSGGFFDDKFQDNVLDFFRKLYAYVMILIRNASQRCF